MANLENIIANKADTDAAWKEQRQMERDAASEMRDAGITEITENPAAYAQYLDLQGLNPTYSAGNVAIAQFSLENPTQFGTAERWKSLGRTIIESEKDKGAKIFTRSGVPNRGYVLADAYDISQTQGKAVKIAEMTDGTPQMETALSTLLNYSPVPVVSDRELDCPAFYDAEKMEIVVNPDYSDSEAFGAIATEIAHARIHGKGSNAAYSREDSRLDAESVSYILCKRFSVERELPDTSGVAKLYEGWDIDERTEALDRIHDMAKQIGRSIELSITPEKPRPQVRVTANRTAR